MKHQVLTLLSIMRVLHTFPFDIIWSMPEKLYIHVLGIIGVAVLVFLLEIQK